MTALNDLLKHRDNVKEIRDRHVRHAMTRGNSEIPAWRSVAREAAVIAATCAVALGEYHTVEQALEALEEECGMRFTRVR